MAQLQAVVMKNVAIILAFAAFVAFFSTVVHKNRSYSAYFGAMDGQPVQRAASLTAVTSQTCPPCQKVKKHIQQLRREGYMCVIIDFNDYTGPENITMVPTLLYFDKDGNLLFKEVGYRTYEQIKSKLIPAYKIS